MSSPTVLLVDDSEAILEFEKGVLGKHYVLHTATNGREALRLAEQLRPDVILLDISMPELSGDKVLDVLQANAELREISVVMISTEVDRAAACMERGAVAYLPKPLRADELEALVGRVFSERRATGRRGGLGALMVGLGELTLGFPLDDVRQVVLQPATQPLPGGPPFLNAFFELHGEPVCVLDLAARLEITHRVALVDRKLVILDMDTVTLAVPVDSVQDPEEFAAERVRPRAALPAEYDPLKAALVGMVHTGEGGWVALLDPVGLLSPDALDKLPALLALGAST